ncbi:Transaldolase [Glycine soja]
MASYGELQVLPLSSSAEWTLLLTRPLRKLAPSEALNLRGKVAVAQAALAYQLYQRKFYSPRWEVLVKKGTKNQRLLSVSTNVKNPAYSDTLYVASLIGPDTQYLVTFHLSTMPDQALQTFIDHGTVSRTIDSNASEAEGIYNAFHLVSLGKINKLLDS